MTLQQLNRRLTAKLLEQVRGDLPGLVYSTKVTSGGIVLRTSPRKLRALSFYIRNSSRFLMRTLVDIAVVDRIRGKGRFVVNYLFLSMTLNQRIILQIAVNETTTIPSLTAPFVNSRRLFACAAWLEREVWDMYGLYFSEHGDLRRILTDYGFAGHPLRKDFPLTGFHEVLYSDTEGRVISQPVELAQEFRTFHL